MPLVCTERSGKRGTWASDPWSLDSLPVGDRAGPTKRAKSPEKIAPKHAAILVTRAADKITNEQQTLLDRIMAQCPDVYDSTEHRTRISVGLEGGERWTTA